MLSLKHLGNSVSPIKARLVGGGGAFQWPCPDVFLPQKEMFCLSVVTALFTWNDLHVDLAQAAAQNCSHAITIVVTQINLSGHSPPHLSCPTAALVHKEKALWFNSWRIQGIPCLPLTLQVTHGPHGGGS